MSYVTSLYTSLLAGHNGLDMYSPSSYAEILMPDMMMVKSVAPEKKLGNEGEIFMKENSTFI